MLRVSFQEVSWGVLAMTLFAATSILIISSLVYNLLLHPLAHVPGPFWARISGIPSYYHAFRGDRHIWLLQHFQTYGKRVRVEPNTVVFSDPDAYPGIYGTKANVRRSKFYLAFRVKENEYNTINTIDVAEHAHKRKMLSTIFTEKMVRAASGFVVQHLDRWHEILTDEISPNESDGWSPVFDFSERIDALVFDIIGDLSFGRSLNIKEPGENPLKVIPHSIVEYMKIYYPMCRSPALDLLLWLKPRGLNQLFQLMSPPAVVAYEKFMIDGVTDRIALYETQKDRPEEEKRLDMFHFLCDAKNPDTGLPAYSEAELRSEAALLVVAGSDTTSVSLSGTFFYLTGNPEKYQKLVDEILATFSTVDDIVYGPTLHGCTYLKACIDEGMRLAPAGPSELPREILAGGQVIAGEYYPAGVVVGTSSWVDSRNVDVYGDAEVFRPERWIVDETTGVTKESVAKLKSHFHPFTTGLGACLGKSLAISEMMLVVARTLYRFHVRRAPGSTFGAGSPELGWGASDSTQMHLQDAYITLRQGPEVQFRKRQIVA